MNQLNLVVEALSHPVGVALPNVARNRFKPPASCPRHASEGCQRTLTPPLNEFPKRRTGRLVVFALKPLAQVLHPVNDFTQLGKAPAPVGPRDQLVHVELIGQFQPAFTQFFELFGFIWVELSSPARKCTNITGFKVSHFDWCTALSSFLPSRQFSIN